MKLKIIVSMKRRKFFNSVGLGLLTSFLSTAIAACFQDSSTKTSSSSPNVDTKTSTQEWQKVTSLVELDQEGKFLFKDSPIGSVLVVGTSQATQEIFAVNPSCTHQGCTIDWKTDKNEFVCPCHGAQFTLNGQVKNGPAQQPLQTYLTKIEDGFVFVKSVA